MKAVPAILIFACCGFLCCIPGALSAQQRPNVLFILADDLGRGDLGCYGNGSVSTPNIDRLAAESVEFDRFCTDPQDAPARAALLTGRYALRMGVSGETARRNVLRAEETTAAEVFRAAGYRTAIFGKWNNGRQYPNDPAGQGFDEFLGFYGDHPEGCFNPKLVHNDTTIQPEGFITDILTDSAIQFMARTGTRPFFCFLPFNVPHSPAQCPDVYFDKYKKAGLDDREAAVYGQIENLDDNIGRLLRALDSLGIRDNTFVVVLGSNGSEGDQSSLYESGIRVPCLIHRRNYLSPKRMTAPAAHIDLLPTLTGLCEMSLPDHIRPDGANLSRIMQGAPEMPGNRMLFFHLNGEKTGPYPGLVRAGRFACLIAEPGKTELYNLIADPDQTRDLADSLDRIAAQLSRQYLDWYAAVTRSGLKPPPIPVGRPESPETELPATEARPGGALRFYGDGLTGWSTPRDTAAWELDVHSEGEYAVAIRYSCDSTFAGNGLRVASADDALEFVVSEAFPEAEANDRMPHKETGVKTWKTAQVGSIRLKAGRQSLSLMLKKRVDGLLEVEVVTLKKV